MISSNHSFGVIFDMDGVLVDSYAPHLESWIISLRERGREVTREEFDSFFGRTSREILEELFGQPFSDADVQEFDNHKESLYRELIRGKIPAVPGLFELLEDVRRNGGKMAVGSSGPIENIDFVLDGLGIRKFFSTIVCNTDVSRGKPDPEVFLLAAKRLGLSPDRCVVIEDAPPGILAARSGGMNVIALATSFPQNRLSEATMVVSDLKPISATLIKSLLG